MTVGPLDTATHSSTLVIVAHPDDEVLVCGGTIAQMAESGIRVHVACLSDGAQDRGAVLDAACSALGASCELFGFDVNALCADGELVSLTDRLVDEHQPDVIITHSPGQGQSQDHRAACQAVRTTVSRRLGPALLLLGSPPFATTDFAPTLFVDVAETWSRKMQALRVYRAVLDRDYMREEYLRVKCGWWSQVGGRPGGLCEAFQVDLWRSWRQP
jgi:N-acetylglucosamine malate deacetylase 1